MLTPMPGGTSVAVPVAAIEVRTVAVAMAAAIVIVPPVVAVQGSLSSEVALYCAGC